MLSHKADDSEILPPLPPNASEIERIEWKRRQNTIAALKSRKRKLQYQQELEADVERLTSEKKVWEDLALRYQAVLQNHGVDVPTQSLKNGTRKNVNPESLVPLDVPTDPRKYATPSATSRKELPAVFAKKRAQSKPFGDEGEEDGKNPPLPPNASESEQIEWMRRRNTIAARKSRKRKLQYRLELEAAVERMTSEKETWKVRAIAQQEMLRQHGVELPGFS
jgi:Basic region leucine zipper